MKQPKILLIDPYFKEGLKGFLLGLSYICGSLKKAGYKKIKALDLTAYSFIKRENWKKVLIKEFKKFNPDLVGITSTSPTHFRALETAKIIKRLKDIPIIKGGVHETNCGYYTIKNHKEIDYSVVGEGEITIIQLIKALTNKLPLERINGICYRKDKNIIFNKRRNLIKNLDRLPKPSRKLFYLDKKFDKYYSSKIFNGKKSTSIMTSRGCPYNCTFCSSKSSWGYLRLRSVKNVLDEIKELYKKNFRGFMFEDDMSLANKKWFLDFSKKLIKTGLKIEYSLQTRVDAIDEEIVSVLRNSGCIYMYFGVESGVKKILKRCNKQITIEQVKKAFDLCRKYKIKSMASIQFGLPGEDFKEFKTVRQTIRLLNYVLKPNEVAISYTSLYPGSPLSIKENVSCEMYENKIRDNAVIKFYKKIAHGSFAIHPEGLTKERINKIERILKKELKIPRFQELYHR